VHTQYIAQFPKLHNT